MTKDTLIFEVTVKIRANVRSRENINEKTFVFLKESAMIKFVESFGIKDVETTLKVNGVLSDSHLLHCFSTYSESNDNNSPVAYILVNPTRPDDIMAELCLNYGKHYINDFKNKEAAITA